MGEWMPIASAPRDGTQFLAFDPEDGECVLSRWSDYGDEFRHHPGGWAIKPLHWMPLPSLPQGGADGMEVGGG